MAAQLERSRSPKGSVKSDVITAFASRARLNVTASFAFGAGLAAPSRDTASDLIQRSIQLAGVELLRRFNLLPPFPPVGILGGKGGLRCGLGLIEVWGFLALFAAYGFSFFLTELLSLP